MYLTGVEEGAAPPAGFSSAGVSSLAGVSAGGATDGVGVAVVLEEAELVAVAAEEGADAEAEAALGCKRPKNHYFQLHININITSTSTSTQHPFSVQSLTSVSRKQPIITELIYMKVQL